MSIQRSGEYPSPEDIAAQMEAEVQATLTPVAAAPPPPPATPAAPEAPLTWEQRVERAGLTPDQAHLILTKILTEGYFERAFTIYGKLPVVLRSRDGYARQRLLEISDSFRIADPRVQQEIYWRVALAGSLVKLNTETFAHLPPTERDPVKIDAAFTARLAAVDRIPDAMLEGTLFPLISRFDAWVYAALSNGAPSGF